MIDRAPRPDGLGITFYEPSLDGTDAYNDKRRRILNGRRGPGPWPNAVVHRLRVPMPVTVRLVALRRPRPALTEQ